jgi:hypothetical protein
MKLVKRFRRVSVLAMTILLSTPWLFGRSTFGGAVGVVQDATESAVSGAELTLTNLDESYRAKGHYGPQRRI